MSTTGTTIGTTTVERLRHAVEEFGRRVRAVEPGQWGGPTPCTEWDVRALVNHVVGELCWIPPLLEGLTIADIGERLSGDLLGDDPQRAWAEAATEAVQAAMRPGALEAVVHLSYGDSKADDYLCEVTADIVIHTWDLARAIQADDQLDPQLLAFAEAILEPRAEAWRAAGALGAPIEVPADVDAQTRFLALVGRRSG